MVIIDLLEREKCMWIGLLIALAVVIGICLLWVRIRIFTVTKKKIHFYIVEISLYGKVKVLRKAFFYRWRGQLLKSFFQVTKNGYELIGNKKKPRKKLSKGQKLQIRKILSKLEVKDLDWKIELGLEDAFDTSMACGILYALLNSVVAVFNGYTQIRKASINVSPYYNEWHLKTDILCIIEFKLVKMIMNVLKLLLGK